jgi:hypothetical protein
MWGRLRFSLWSFLFGMMATAALLVIATALWLRGGFSARQKPSGIESAESRNDYPRIELD